MIVSYYLAHAYVYSMNTSFDCMPCFVKMVHREAKLACPGNEDLQRKIVDAWHVRVQSLDLSCPPPAIARHLNILVREMSGCGDLYDADKQRANQHVLSMLPGLRRLISSKRLQGESCALAFALELSIIGNYIDRGVDLKVDWEKELHSVSRTISEDVLVRFDQKTTSGTNVLILGDNTGEIVLDMLVVEELNRRGCRVTYAVRSQPVINDATIVDARSVGMTDLCEVVESGVDTPGTVIERCSKEFLARMHQADVILSKGQGNYESLVGRWPEVFYAFKVKCLRVSHDTGFPLGSSVLCQPDRSSDDPLQR